MSSSVLILEGDSLSAGTMNSPGRGLSYQLQEALGDDWTVTDVAAGGDTLASIASAEGVQVDSQYVSGAVMMIWAGTNDLCLSPTVGLGSITYELLKKYVAARKATGFRVIVATILDRFKQLNGQTLEGFNTEKDSFNSLVRANWRTFADGLYDAAADKRLSYLFGTAYMQGDKVHPTDLGTSLIAAGVLNSLSTLLQGILVIPVKCDTATITIAVSVSR